MSTHTTVLEQALLLACERIADDAQTYEEANTPEGWRDEFIKKASEKGDFCTHDKGTEIEVRD